MSDALSDAPTISEILPYVSALAKEERRVYRREYNQRPDAKAKQRAYHQHPDVKAKQRAYRRAYYQRHAEEIKAKQRAYYQRPEVKVKQRAYHQRRSLKGLSIDEIRERMTEKYEKGGGRG